MTEETFEPNVEYAWKDEASWKHHCSDKECIACRRIWPSDGRTTRVSAAFAGAKKASEAPATPSCADFLYVIGKDDITKIADFTKHKDWPLAKPKWDKGHYGVFMANRSTLPRGWHRVGPYYAISVVFSDRGACGAYPAFCAKCTSTGVQSERTHVRELWRWKHSRQLVKEFCRDLTVDQLRELLCEVGNV